MTPREVLSRLHGMRSEMTVRQGLVLLLVHEGERVMESRTVRGMAATIGSAKPTITRALDVLQEAGLVKRIPDPDDMRSILVVPTAAGRKFVERLGAQ